MFRDVKNLSSTDLPATSQATTGVFLQSQIEKTYAFMDRA